MRERRSRHLGSAELARVESSSRAPGKNRGIAPEAPDGAVDAEEELPEELRDGRDALQRVQRVARMVTGEHHGRPGDDDQRVGCQNSRPACKSLISPDGRPNFGPHTGERPTGSRGRAKRGPEAGVRADDRKVDGLGSGEKVPPARRCGPHAPGCVSRAECYISPTAAHRAAVAHFPAGGERLASMVAAHTSTGGHSRTHVRCRDCSCAAERSRALSLASVRSSRPPRCGPLSHPAVPGRVAVGGLRNDDNTTAAGLHCRLGYQQCTGNATPDAAADSQANVGLKPTHNRHHAGAADRPRSALRPRQLNFSRARTSRSRRLQRPLPTDDWQGRRPRRIGSPSLPQSRSYARD